MTTRSRLRSRWRFPSMMLATLRIRGQLAEAPGLVRWASVVVGPTEFWTVTVWDSRHDMQEFMRSGAHEKIMWSFSKWLESFWLMRWRPGPGEIGTWKGTSLAQAEPAYELADSPRSEALALALDHLPRLKAATGADGSASYESTPYARRRRGRGRPCRGRRRPPPHDPNGDVARRSGLAATPNRSRAGQELHPGRGRDEPPR